MLAEEKIQKLVAFALEARQKAHSRYSQFQVGAALLTAEGQMVGGCNVENASYGAAICAERTAIVSAVSQGWTRFQALAVVADTSTPCPPCGICRQVISEFFDP